MSVHTKMNKHEKIIYNFLKLKRREIYFENDRRLATSLKETITSLGFADDLDAFTIHGTTFLNIKSINDKERLLNAFDAALKEKSTRLTAEEEAKQQVLREKRRKNNKAQRIKTVEKYVDVLCEDFSPADIDYIKKSIVELYTQKAFTEVLVGVASAIYLMSKCPANTDVPLSISEITKRVNTIAPRPRSSISLTISKLSTKIKTCRITPEMLIVANRRELLNIVSENTISNAIILSKNSDFKREFIGRNPYVLSASLIIIELLSPSKQTLLEICKLFNVSLESTKIVKRKWFSICEKKLSEKL
jgi:hypothetical protein